MSNLVEDILWCMLNPAYGLARLYELIPAPGVSGIHPESTDEVSITSAMLTLLLLAYAKWH